MKTLDLSTIKKEDFDKYLNTNFVMHLDNQESVTIKLVDTIDKTTDNTEGFSLHFLGNFDTIFPQKIYTLSHDAMGEISIFIVPISKNDNGIMYESIFLKLKNY